MSFIKKIGLVCFIVFCCAGCRSAGEKLVESAAAPRIINIINFIRQTDYRVENADSLLYETVCEQVKLVNKYDLPATFLLQYDALINPLYQDLLKSKLNAHSEIGAWWELTQPSLEPVYEKAGMDRRWVDYFLESIVNQPCLAFNYAQAGQENSFTWSNMSKGLEMQIPILDSLRKENKIRVETLGESGAWFKECFKVTPPTAVTTLTDVRGEGNKTVWFNSRYYRANLLWERGTFRFRDIHLFDEGYKSAYLEKPGDGNQFLFYTLPVVDGFMWSEGLDRAGLRIVRLDKDGDKEELTLDHPVVTEIGKDTLVVSAEDSKGHPFKITFYETRFEVAALSKEADLSWALELKVAAGKELPFTVIEDKAVNASFDGFNYVITCEKGHIRKPESGSDYAFRILPSDQEIVIDCTNTRLNCTHEK